jgi:SPP1 gp7 family putative phage head morphogenesis protein
MLRKLRSIKTRSARFQVKKNMDWSLGEALYQNASPLRELELPEDAEDDEFDEAEKNFTDISARDTFVSPSGYKIHVHDTGKALNPQPTIDYTMDTIGGSARIPRAILLGAQAGAISGSETNIKDYFKGITTIQKNFIDPLLMGFYRQQQKFKILVDGDFELEWNPVWEMTEKEDAEIDLMKARKEYLKAQTVLAYLKCEFDVKIDEEGEVTVKGEGVAPQQPFGQMGKKSKIEKDYYPKGEMTKIYEKFNLNTQEVMNEFKTHFLLRHLIAQKRITTKLEGSYKSAMLKAQESLKTDDKADFLAELLKLDISDPKLRDLIISSLQGAFKFGGERTNVHLADYMGMMITEPFELDDVQAREWMETSRLIYEDYKDKFVGYIKRSLMEGIAAGESLEQLKDRIAKVGKKYEGNIDTLVRTEIHNAAEKGRIEGYIRNGLKKTEYINGPNPCDECSALAGTILTVEEAARFVFPHPNCQCGFVPYVEGGFKW